MERIAYCLKTMAYCRLLLKFFSSRKPALERYSYKLDHFHKCTDLVPNGRTDPERICQVPYKRKAYPWQFCSGSKWIQSRVNAALDSGGLNQMWSPSLLREVSVRPSVSFALWDVLYREVSLFSFCLRQSQILIFQLLSFRIQKKERALW